MSIAGIYAVIAALLLTIGGSVGYKVTSYFADKNLMQCELGKQDMLLANEREASKRIKQAAQSSDEALANAMQRITDAEQQTEEIKNELKKHTTGRDCLSSDARRLLQSAAAFKKQRMSGSAESADPAVAAATQDTGDARESAASTDTDIAAWISDASRLYEQCRARIDAIGQWDAELNGRH